MLPGKAYLSLRLSMTFVSLAAFILLGFCPLRNTLIRLAGGVPEKVGRTIPEYKKITSATHCEVHCTVKELPPVEQVDPRPQISFVADLPAAYDYDHIHFECYHALPSGLRDWVSSIPIYLRNGVLRI